MSAAASALSSSFQCPVGMSNGPALPGPLVFFVFSAVVAVICYAVHRWTFLSGLIAAAGCLFLGWVSLRQASGEPVALLGRVWVIDRTFVLLGREWAFTSSNLAVLTFILFIAGLAFLLALPSSQGWAFYPFGMGVVAALVLAATAQQFIYSILFLWLGVILAVFVLSGGRPGATVGSVRFLALASVAVMPLLVLPGYLGPDADPGAVHTASVLLVIGFGMLLMLVPFHGQLVAIAAHSAPMVPAFVLSAFPAVVFHTLFSLGRSYPALFQDRLLFDVCRWLGLAAAAIGGIAAAGQRRWGYLVGYATLVDWGAGLIALGQGTRQGVEWAMHMLVWRALSLLLVGAGLTVTYKAASKKDDIVNCGGMLQRRLLGVLALVGGLFSLAGFPLTPGAAGRWPLIASLLISEPEAGWVLILAGLGVSIGTLVGLSACLGPVPADMTENRLDAVVAMVFSCLALWLIAWFFLHPALWLDLARRVAGELGFLVA